MSSDQVKTQTTPNDNSRETAKPTKESSNQLQELWGSGTSTKDVKMAGHAMLGSHDKSGTGIGEKAATGDQLAMLTVGDQNKSKVDLDKTVKELGSEDFETRQKARETLEKAGADGLEALLKKNASGKNAFTGDDLQTQITARGIVEERLKAYAGKKSSDTTNQSFSEAVKKLSREGEEDILIDGKPLPKPKLISDFADLVNHPALKTDSDKSAKELGILAKIVQDPKNVDLSSDEAKAEAAKLSALQRDYEKSGDLKKQLVDIGKSITTIVATHEDTDDTLKAALPYLPNLKNLSLGRSQITGKSFDQVGKLTGLEELNIGGLKIIDGDLKKLEGLTNLKTLEAHNNNGDTFDPISGDVIPGIGITDAGMGSIAKLSKLQKLRLQNTQISDLGIGDLTKLKNLQSLSVSGENVTNAGLKHIGSMKNLSSLALNETAITDAGLKHLADLKGLSELQIYGSKISDQGLQDLAKLNLPITNLTIHSPEITDSKETFEALGNMKELKELLIPKGDKIVDSEGFEKKLNEIRKKKGLSVCKVGLIETI